MLKLSECNSAQRSLCARTQENQAARAAGRGSAWPFAEMRHHTLSVWSCLTETEKQKPALKTPVRIFQLFLSVSPCCPSAESFPYLCSHKRLVVITALPVEPVFTHCGSRLTSFQRVVTILVIFHHPRQCCCSP